MKWEKVQTKGDIPPGVAAHSAVALGKNIFIFGGLTADGASNSMYRFNTGTGSLTFLHSSMTGPYLLMCACSNIMPPIADKSRWGLMKFEGDMPPNRLDHCMCLLPWKVCEGGSSMQQQASSPAASETITLAFIFGGMDTQGVIHNDCVVTVVT